MKRKKFTIARKSLAFASLLSLFVISCKKEASLNQQAISNDQPGQLLNNSLSYVPNELIVKFKDLASNSKRNEALSSIGGSIREKIVTQAMISAGDNEGITLVHTSLETMEAVARLKKGSTEIVFAEPNYIYEHGAVSTDPYYTNGSLWGMNGTYGSKASVAWAAGHTGSASVVVGVIDEGIQYTHPDLAGQIWTNPFDPIDGIDNDHNGYKDDIHGWDFNGNNNSIYDGGAAGNLDDHGTHVSGTIGAKSNASGVVGVNWNVTIISTKFLGSAGGTTANAIKAVDYLTDLKTRHNMNIVASNNSWGGGGFSQALLDAINRANVKNILFVAAAGNGGADGIGDNNNVTPNYPSNYTSPNIIAVAAITSTGARASFSNYGSTTVDLGAPGQGIWSTTAFNLYSSYSGTSMATPHVTGAAALYRSTHPTATAAQIKAAILSTTIPTASLTGKCVSGGRLNVSTF
ncbi:MAG: S8 family peptidase [Ferruginibacter sp.]